MWRRHPGRLQAGRRGSKHLPTRELIKVALIITLSLHQRRCVANHCITQITASHKSLRWSHSWVNVFLPCTCKEVPYWSKLPEEWASWGGARVSTGASLTQSVWAQGPKRTLKAIFLLSSFDCCALLACGSRPPLSYLPFPEVHLAINGRFEFRHSPWGKSRLQ